MPKTCCKEPSMIQLIIENIEEIRDKIDVVVSYRPGNEYEVLEELSNNLTDIITKLKQKKGD